MITTKFIRISVLGLFLFEFIPDAAYGNSSDQKSIAQAVSKPERASLASLLPTFEQYAEKVRKTWKVPGLAVAIVESDKLVYAKGFGVKRIGTNDPVDPHTVFQIGSTSRTARCLSESSTGFDSSN